jgi:hydroxymethylglutaryl-CoA synthase
MSVIVTRGTYIPAYRLSRDVLGAGNGTRAVASFDEDAASLGVEAARRALAGAPRTPCCVLFATTAPPYADRTNATAIHAALGLPPRVAAYDTVGSMRSAMGALRAAIDAADAGRTSLVVSADVRVGLPGSADEREGGDGAAAVVVAPEGPGLAEILALASATGEFLDRWRVPGELYSRVWEERFGESAYAPLADAALADALADAGVSGEDVNHLVVTGLHRRAVTTARRTAAVAAEAIVDDRSAALGVTGAAHPLLLLTDVLERARPGQIVVLLVLADGADCVVLRAGPRAGDKLPGPTVADQLDGSDVSYHDMLVWRGLLRREPPRRPAPDRPAAPPAKRNAEWKFGFVGSRCLACGTRHLPPARVCLSCRAIDRMEREPLAGLRGVIKTLTVDHLAYSLAPPVVVGIVDLEGGGRLRCELTDVDPDTVAAGDRVALTFRRHYTTADGIHDYFWKARPLRAEES